MLRCRNLKVGYDTKTRCVQIKAKLNVTTTRPHRNDCELQVRGDLQLQGMHNINLFWRLYYATKRIFLPVVPQHQDGKKAQKEKVIMT